MLTEERKQMILSLLEKNDIVKSQELIQLLNTSESTVRRDLKELEAEGLLKRVHGGAQKIVHLEKEPTMSEKSFKNIQEKQSIAKFSASLIKNDSFIFIDAGTSTYELIPYLKDKNITVVTNSVHHAALLTDYNINTIIIGGTIKNSTKAVVSIFSSEQLQMFRFDIAFIGINGIHHELGYTTPDLNEASMKSVAMMQAEKVFILADHTKFNKVSFTKVADLEKGTIITDYCPKEYKKDIHMQTTIKEINI